MAPPEQLAYARAMEDDLADPGIRLIGTVNTTDRNQARAATVTEHLTGSADAAHLLMDTLRSFTDPHEQDLIGAALKDAALDYLDPAQRDALAPVLCTTS